MAADKKQCPFKVGDYVVVRHTREAQKQSRRYGYGRKVMAVIRSVDMRDFPGLGDRVDVRWFPSGSSWVDPAILKKVPEKLLSFYQLKYPWEGAK